MNVGFSDNITDITKTLRSTVYCNDEFKQAFTDELKKSICAIDTQYVPEQFGGWSINVSVDRDKCKDVGIDQTSSSYIGKISNALIASIHNIDHSASYESVANNLANVIITGNDSIVVKL